MQADNFAF